MSFILEIPQPIPALPSPECIRETHQLIFSDKGLSDGDETEEGTP